MTRTDTIPRNWIAEAHDSGCDLDELARRYAAGADTYNATAAADGYHGAAEVARQVRSVRRAFGLAAGQVRVLDAGCGTGLLGAALAGPGYRIDGVDLVPDMIARAHLTGAYHRLTAHVDLHEPWTGDEYDITVSAGVFTHGHVRPHALTTLVAATRTGGFVVASVSLTWAHQVGFEEYLHELRRTGLIDLLRWPLITDYVQTRPGDDGRALYLRLAQGQLYRRVLAVGVQNHGDPHRLRSGLTHPLPSGAWPEHLLPTRRAPLDGSTLGRTL